MNNWSYEKKEKHIKQPHIKNTNTRDLLFSQCRTDIPPPSVFASFSLFQSYKHIHRLLQTSAHFALGSFGSLWARYCTLEATIWYSHERADKPDHKTLITRSSAFRQTVSIISLFFCLWITVISWFCETYFLNVYISFCQRLRCSLSWVHLMFLHSAITWKNKIRAQIIIRKK